MPSEALEQARTAALEAATRKASSAAKAPAAGGSAAAESAKADDAPDSPADKTADAADSDAAAAADATDASAAGAAAEEQEAGDEKQDAAVVKPTGPDPTVDVLMALRADLLKAAEAAGLPAGGVEVLFQVPGQSLNPNLRMLLEAASCKRCCRSGNCIPCSFGINQLSRSSSQACRNRFARLQYAAFLLQGTDSSRVEAILRAVPEGRAPSLSGLEVRHLSLAFQQLPRPIFIRPSHI